MSDLGGVPIDYQHADFVTEIHRVTSDGVDVVFDGIGGAHIWRSRKAVRPGGKVVPTASRPRSGRGDWVRVVDIAFAESPSSASLTDFAPYTSAGADSQLAMRFIPHRAATL